VRCVVLCCVVALLLTQDKGRLPETTLRCIRYLRLVTSGSTISVEVEKPGREGLVELAAEADVVFYSRSWAGVSPFPVFPRAVFDVLWHFAPRSRL
jgi:ketohexokinase